MVYLGKTVNYKFHYGAKPVTFAKANILRKNMTETEKLLWQRLRNRKLKGLKFRRQHPIDRYIVDFFCAEKELVIEIDGGIHNKSEIRERDENRTYDIERFGLKIIRFTNEEVKNDIGKVLERIVKVVK